MSDNRLYRAVNKDKCSCKGSNLDRFLQPKILVLLAHENMHGYSIIQRLENEKPFMCEKFDSTGVYRTLQSMEARGLVVSNWDIEGTGAAKKTYKITPGGLDCLSNWLVTLREYQKTITGLIDEIEKTILISTGQ